MFSPIWVSTSTITGGASVADPSAPSFACEAIFVSSDLCEVG